MSLPGVLATLPPGSELVEIPLRDERLPAVYKIPDHPKVAHPPGAKMDIYLLVEDPNDSKLSRRFADAEKMEFPVSTEKSVVAAGEYFLIVYPSLCSSWVKASRLWVNALLFCVALRTAKAILQKTLSSCTSCIREYPPFIHALLFIYLQERYIV